MYNTTHPSQELSAAITHLTSLQKTDGFIAGEVVWCPMITAQYVMVAYITKQAISPERKNKFIHYFATWQTKEGGWGLHPESSSYVFTTTLVYVALRLLDVAANNLVCEKALKWLREYDGVLQIPSWGKFWLALLNFYQWDGVNPILPEMWLQAEWSPIHPKLLYCHTRLIYLSMSYLYGIKFQIPETSLIKELRQELYNVAYETINFKNYRHAIATTDVYVKPALILKMIYRGLRMYDTSHSPVKRKTALDKILAQVIYHQRQTNYAAISPVNGLLNTVILYHAQHPDFTPSFQGVNYWLWEDDTEGQRFAGAKTHTWDTAFAVQAICENPPNNTDIFLQAANDYFKQAIMQNELPDREGHYQDIIMGGFCLSDATHRWPVSDCTSEALSALCLLRKHVPREKQISTQMILASVNFILSRQNNNGGWGSYEKRRGGFLLELFNPTEMFGDCMVEHSYIECTGSSVHALQQAVKYFPELQDNTEFRAIKNAIVKGAAFLRRTQLRDGSWPGFWGINYIYGTLFGVTGLLASGASSDDPAVISACQFIISKHLPDGGWGETWQSCREHRYIPHNHSQVIMTSWALIILLKANYHGPQADTVIAAGIALLKKRQLPTGDWPTESVAGVFFGTAMLRYTLYKNYFPIWALTLYEKQKINRAV